MQHITYAEYLPPLRGPALSAPLLPSSPSTYNASATAAITNAFGAAAFRFGHAMVPDKMR